MQPKRLALLAYLAVGRAETHARDKLLATFWPESDTGHARAALRQAVHFIRSNIRSSLGPDILVSTGSDDLGLRRDLVWCDVIEFEDRIAAGDAAGAIALYRGDFLQGVYVPEARDFEHWVDSQRARLRSAATMACLTAAEAEARTSARGALFWANRGEMISPTSERLVRMIISLNERLGDRAGAIAKFDEFAAWLRQEHGLEPEKETVALVATIKSRRPTGEQVEKRSTPTEDVASILSYHTPPQARPRLEQGLTPRGGDENARPDWTPSDYRDLVEGALDIIYTADEAGNLRAVNEAATRILGYRKEELHGKSLLRLVEHDYRPAVLAFYAKQVQERVPTTYNEFPIRTAAGNAVWLGQIMHVIEKEHGVVHLHGVARDITLRRGSAQPEAMFAWRDPLTGLYNGEAFVVLAEHRRALALETGIPLEFLMVSLPTLSQVEQEHGNPEAKRALMLTAQALQETFRRSDIIAHLDRNRFVILGSDWNGAGICTAILRERIASRATVRLGFDLPVEIVAVKDSLPETVPVSGLLELKAS